MIQTYTQQYQFIPPTYEVCQWEYNFLTFRPFICLFVRQFVCQSVRSSTLGQAFAFNLVQLLIFLKPYLVHDISLAFPCNVRFLSLGSGPWRGPQISYQDLSIFSMSKFCIYPFRMFISLKMHHRDLLFLIHHIAIALF